MKRMILSAAAATLASLAIQPANAAVIYASIPDLKAAPIVNAWCSDCYGGSTFEPLDPFFLTGSIHVSGLRLVTGPDFPGTPYLGFAGFTVEIYNAAHSTVIFSQMLSPALDATTPNGTVILKASISGLTLGAGSYWAGFIAPVLGVPGFSGGNGGLIDTTPHTGSPLFALGGNTGYELLGAVPEPEPWALLIGGFALAGAALRRRRGRFAPA